MYKRVIANFSCTSHPNHVCPPALATSIASLEGKKSYSLSFIVHPILTVYVPRPLPLSITNPEGKESYLTQTTLDIYTLNYLVLFVSNKYI